MLPNSTWQLWEDNFEFAFHSNSSIWTMLYTYDSICTWYVLHETKIRVNTFIPEPHVLNVSLYTCFLFLQLIHEDSSCGEACQVHQGPQSRGEDFQRTLRPIQDSLRSGVEEHRRPWLLCSADWAARTANTVWPPWTHLCSVEDSRQAGLEREWSEEWMEVSWRLLAKSSFIPSHACNTYNPLLELNFLVDSQWVLHKMAWVAGPEGEAIHVAPQQALPLGLRWGGSAGPRKGGFLQGPIADRLGVGRRTPAGWWRHAKFFISTTKTAEQRGRNNSKKETLKFWVGCSCWDDSAGWLIIGIYGRNRRTCSFFSWIAFHPVRSGFTETYSLMWNLMRKSSFPWLVHQTSIDFSALFWASYLSGKCVECKTTSRKIVCCFVLFCSEWPERMSDRS